MPVAPEAVTQPPKSIPPCHDLLRSALIVDDRTRWESGFVFQPENCIEADVFNPCGVTSEIQQITVDASQGTWELTYDVTLIGAFAFDISAFDLQQALEAIPAIGVGNVVVSGGPGDVGGTTPYTITFTRGLAETNVPDIVPADIDLAGGGATVGAAVVQEAGLPIQKSAYSDPTEDVFYDPFQVEVPYECSSFGWQATEYERRAMDQLELGKSKAMEAEYWTGNKIPTNPSLVGSTPNDDDHILNPGGAAAPVAVSPGIALILFAQALANCGTGSRGYIHATPALVERWSNLTAIAPALVSSLGGFADFIDSEEVLVTPARCDIVVSGSGYPGTGPIGQPPPGPNEVWAYATGPVQLRMGEPELIPKTIEEALDRATNTVTYRGELTAAVTDDLCCRFAILVDLCQSI